MKDSVREFFISSLSSLFSSELKENKIKARKNNRRARTGNTRSAQRNGANAPVTRAQGTSTPVVATEAVPQRVYRPRNKVSDQKLRSQAKKQATKKALQSASSSFQILQEKCMLIHVLQDRFHTVQHQKKNHIHYHECFQAKHFLVL